MKKIITAAAIIIVLALLVCLLPFPQRINKSLSGVCWYSSTSPAEEAELTVKGWYFRYLLRQDYFKGTLSYDGREISTERFVLFDTPERSSRYGTVMFYNTDKNQIDAVGPIYIAGSFDSVFIDRSSGTSVKLFSFPAASLDEAVAVANELSINTYN